jgi:hypothetical protein
MQEAYIEANAEAQIRIVGSGLTLILDEFYSVKTV